MDYIEGTEVCTDCGKTLLKEKPEHGDDNVTYEQVHYKLLTNCADDIEANLLVSLLEASDIRSYLEHPGSGEYFNLIQGKNLEGTNVLIPEEDFEAAQEVFRDFQYSRDEIEPEDEEDQLYIKYRKKRETAIIAILIVFLVPFLFYAVMNLDGFF
jgi:hypothetical protein